MTGAWQSISVLVLAASARAQIARPDTRRSLAVPPHPDPSLGTVEETYGGRANVTWPDGSGYSVMMSHNGHCGQRRCISGRVLQWTV